MQGLGLGLAFEWLDFQYLDYIALGEFRQGLGLFVILLLPEYGFPSGIQHDIALAAEADSIGVEFHRGGEHIAFRGNGFQHSRHHQVIYLLLPFIQTCGQDFGGQQGVVVGHLGLVHAVAVEFYADEIPGLVPEARICLLQLYQGRKLREHVVRNEARSRPRIGEQLLLVKGLGRVQTFLGGYVVFAVRLFLQRGKVVKIRRLQRFRLLLHLRHDQFATGCDLLHIRVEFLAVVVALLCRGREYRAVLARRHFQVPEGLWHEIAVLVEAAAHHSQRRRLHTAEREQLPASRGYGQRARGVDAHQPVGLVSRLACVVEAVEVGRRHKRRQSFSYRIVGQRRYPQTLYRLAAAYVGIYISLNKFSFAAGIACIYDIVGFVDQFAYYRKLVRVAAVVCLAAVLSFALSHPEVEVFRQYGQRVYHPRDVRLRSEYLHQVTEGPGYGISIAGHISLTPHLRAHDTGQVPSHRRLLGNDCNHLTVELCY